MQILIVEDEAAIARFLERGLNAHGHRVVCAYDGEEGTRLAVDEPVDLVLLDIMMPFVSGLEVLEQARELPHRQGTPVIMLTAKGHDADRTRAFELGAADFLTKPFSPNKLLARIDELFTE